MTRTSGSPDSETYSAPLGISHAASGEDTLPKADQYVTVEEPRQALFQLVALIAAILAIGYYIVVYKPGIPAQDVRSVLVPTHPSNGGPVDLLTAVTTSFRSLFY